LIIVFPGVIGAIATKKELNIPTFAGSATFIETYEYPDWLGTYDTGSIIIPTFSGSATFTETFESGSWPNP
jgi:hypothetical protein